MGRVAYEAYVASCGGKSVHGEPLPSWPGQKAEIRQHWRAAADAVLIYADLQQTPVTGYLYDGKVLAPGDVTIIRAAG